jgi:spore coat protein A, manganese oxidase
MGVMQLLTRREMLKLSLFGGSGFIFAPNQMGGQMGGGQMGGQSSPVVTPFQSPLQILSVLSSSFWDPTTDYYTVTMQQAEVEIIPKTRTTLWGYDGLYPGPTIKARKGRKVVIRQINNLPEKTVVHLHGGHVPAEADGYPTDYILPGFFKDYVYPNNQDAATLWYHDHTMDVTGPHVYRGLAGLYIINDDFEQSLPLPKDENDIALLIQDRLFNSDGSLNYSTSGMMGGMMDNMFMGDTILVNGVIQPYLQVGTRKMRFRILNGSNARNYNLALSSGKPFIQIGSDGGLLPKPILRSSINIYPGERVDLIIDFTDYSVGSQIILRNNAGSGRLGSVMRFDVARSEIDESTIPSILRPFEKLQQSSATVTRSFTLSKNATGLWVINGQPFDSRRVGASPRLEDVEIWRFINQSGMTHPIHIHDVMFQVLSVNGRPPSTGSGYDGWKDTIQVPGWGEVQAIAKFTDYLGLYVIHCHILEHEDRGMMAQFKVM